LLTGIELVLYVSLVSGKICYMFPLQNVVNRVDHQQGISYRSVGHNFDGKYLKASLNKEANSRSRKKQEKIVKILIETLFFLILVKCKNEKQCHKSSKYIPLKFVRSPVVQNRPHRQTHGLLHALRGGRPHKAVGRAPQTLPHSRWGPPLGWGQEQALMTG
jgi:hypothetical protein